MPNELNVHAARRAAKVFVGFAVFSFLCFAVKHFLAGDFWTVSSAAWLQTFELVCGGSAVIGIIAFCHFRWVEPKQKHH